MAVALVALSHSCTTSTETKQCCEAYVPGNELAALENPQATTAAGVLEGVNESGVAVFRGVPFAAPPVGELRWKAPQPVENWTGVRSAKEFGPNPMQIIAFADMIHEAKVNSEDCLYLNIWTPATSTAEKLPVFIYFNGGGLMNGSGSEPRYAGMSLARNGIVAITANYREDIFGFFSHPELSAETEYHGSGNYGHMDQAAAIQWVKDNIAAFGGDPDHITIMGESAGSYSVSVMMVTPLAKNNIAQAMGSSEAVVTKTIRTLEEAEAEGVEIQNKLGCANLAELRAIPAEELLEKGHLPEMPHAVIDGYVLLENPYETYKKGEQAQVPCLIGNNQGEMVPQMVCGPDVSLNGVREGIKRWTGADGEDLDKLMELYGLTSDESVTQLPGNLLGGDYFVAFRVWKWTDVQAATSSQPVYRYRFTRARPDLVSMEKRWPLYAGDKPAAPKPESPYPAPSFHSVDIVYEMGNIPTSPHYAWTAQDFDISLVFKNYFINFIKTGNPNGLGLPNWVPINGEEIPPVMLIGEKTGIERNAKLQERYRLLEKYLAK